MKKHANRQKRNCPAASCDSIAAAAAQMGRPEIELKISKEMGCPGFRGSRVYPAECLPWMQTNAEQIRAVMSKAETKDEADARVARARADRMEFELGVRRRQFIPVLEVRQTFTRAVVACKARMLAIPSSLAPRLALTNNPDECAIAIKSAIIDALTELSKGKWNTEPK